LRAQVVCLFAVFVRGCAWCVAGPILFSPPFAALCAALLPDTRNNKKNLIREKKRPAGLDFVRILAAPARAP
jgi:hypothetical protein